MTPPNGSADNRQLQEDDGSTIVSSKSIPANINVVDNKYITGRKYRTSGNLQKLTQTQYQFRKDVRKPQYSVAVSPHDPTFRPGINLTVPGVAITTPGLQTTYHASQLPTSP